jgi:predicted small lipoprotein YifL
MPYAAAALALATTVLLCGCGQMGPLYKPEEDSAKSAAVHEQPLPARAT